MLFGFTGQAAAELVGADSLDPCQGAPVEIDFTVAEPPSSSSSLLSEPPAIRVITEDARPRADAIARRRAVLDEGLDVTPVPGTYIEDFYPVHRILKVVFRVIC